MGVVVVTLRPIPARILRTSITLNVCTGTDIYQSPTYQAYTVSRCHIQSSVDVRKTRENTEMVLRAVLFIDARLSAPQLDWVALHMQSEAAGHSMTVQAQGMTYTVLDVDAVPDDTDGIHHYEVALV